MSLDAVRAAIDDAPAVEPSAFARRTRNALAQAILAESFTHEPPGPAEHAPPVQDLRELVGDDLAITLAAVYEGADGWASRAIDALEQLHALATGVDR
jgi:hypothetical protein